MAQNLKELFEKGIVRLAEKPAMNSFDPSQLDKLDGYTVPLVSHDYGAKTPIMWNTIYKNLGLNLRNIMVVADPSNAGEIMSALKQDPKYIGGGAGVGFKEKVTQYLDALVPKDLASTNIIVKEGEKLVGYNTDAKGLYQSVVDSLRYEKRSQNRKGTEVKGSNFLIFGAGGVAKEFARELAKGGAGRIVIANRTVKKAVNLAKELGDEYKDLVTYAVDESLIRGATLNTLEPNDAIINTTDKGSDGKLIDTSAFAKAGKENHTLSIDVLRDLSKWNPYVAIIDIALPKNLPTITLRQAASAKLENLVDGIPMVVNQAAPAYKLVEKAFPTLHPKSISESEVLKMMREATK